MRQFDENPPKDGIIGYVDDISNEEEFRINDALETGMVVHVQCSNW
jgi:hypothetical protein